MGWLFMRSIAPRHTPREYLDAQFTHTSATMTRTVLRSAVVKMRTYYAALEILRPDQPREVVGIVGLIKYSKREREGYVFGYKDMSEDMGPCESECPVAILDLLTPTTNEYALDWRKRCRAFAEQQCSKLPLRTGDRITFPEAIRIVPNAASIASLTCANTRSRSSAPRPDGRGVYA